MRLTLLIIRLQFSLFKLTSTQPILNILVTFHTCVLPLRSSRDSRWHQCVNGSIWSRWTPARTQQNSTNALVTHLRAMRKLGLPGHPQIPSPVVSMWYAILRNTSLNDPIDNAGEYRFARIAYKGFH